MPTGAQELRGNGIASRRSRALSGRGNVRDDHFRDIQGQWQEVTGQAEGVHLPNRRSKPTGQEGKWFAAANDAASSSCLIKMANRSPSGLRTLVRAARYFAEERPKFAMASDMTALPTIANGRGYGITGVDVMGAYAAVVAAAGTGSVDEAPLKADVKSLIAGSGTGGDFALRFLSRQLTE